MKLIKVNFWCNAGYTEEDVEVEIFDDIDETEEQQIEKEFLKWLDNNEQCGYEIKN